MIDLSKHRFGIMAMQIDALIPEQARDLPPEQALAGILGFSHAGLVRSLAGQGFNPIEIGGDLGMLLPHTFSKAAIDELAQVKRELGLSYTVHLPLWSLEPSTLQAPVRQGSVQALVDCIRVTAPLEPEIYVLHATGALAAEFYRMRIPELARAILMRQFQSGARESIRTILIQTGIPSRKLAVETIEFPFDLTLELAEEFDTSICFDTGHVLVGFSGPVDFFAALERCLPRLGEVHLHDGPWQGPEMKIGYGKDHSSLGTGDLDVPRFLGRLEQAGFNGPVIFELRVPEALDSLEFVRKLF
jgi:sugar phosphate isomerase/epimerase